ncbi:CRTAC1 family protein [Rubripirellula sp.]|nr:CRTAC1 family protein [Rubripirellula sp.]MDB4749490.1 CRTAC1 family protein [Rubripirellula sp.]
MSDLGPTSSKSSNTEKSAGHGRAVLPLIGGVFVLLCIAAGFWMLSDDQGGKGSGGLDPVISQQLDLTRAALAATENLEVVQADESWSKLYNESASDESVALNRAINRVLRVDALSAKATNASLDDQEKQNARRQVPDAISAAKQAIEDFQKAADDEVLALWLATRVDLHQAALLPGSVTKQERNKVYKRVAAAIRGEAGKSAKVRILGGSLIQVVEQLEDPIDGLPANLLIDAADAIGQLSEQQPDNLFFALRAARLNIATHDSKAIVFVERANRLAKAIEPSIRRETQPIGVTPDELVAQIVAAIKEENWSEAENRMLLWFNVLNSTEIVKTDRRRASPHPLDLLSFDSLRRLSAQAVEDQPLDASNTEFKFESQIVNPVTTNQTVLSLDYDLDLDRDLVTAGEDGLLELWSNEGGGKFSSVGQLQLDIVPRGIVAADLFLVDSSDPQRLRADRKTVGENDQDYSSAARHNTFQSLVVYGADGVRLVQLDGRSEAEEGSRLSLAKADNGLQDVRDVTVAVTGDLEADGDLDLVLATESSGIRLFANRGNRSFFEIAQSENAFSGDDPVSDMSLIDLDRDLDLDVVTVHSSSGKVGMLENLLHLQFRSRFFDEIPPIEQANFITVEDIDGNVSWDLVVAGEGGVSIVFSQTAAANAWTVDHVEHNEHPTDSALVADLDNDSWMEVVALNEQGAAITRIGPWGFRDWQPIKSSQPASDLVVAEFDGDGVLDLAGLTSQGISVLKNCTTPMGHYIDVRFKGIDDNASGRVNHYAVGSVLEMRFGPHYRARIVRSPSTHFGLDGFESASSVRTIFPNGLTQTIRDPKVDSLVEEEQTLKGSCPYLYAWDGEKYVFQTDCLWAAPLGLQVARGIVAKDRPWEYLKINGDQIRPRGDRYDFRITEELWEVAYFDKVSLQVIDHPADVDIWTNEKVGPGQIATPTIFAFSGEDRRAVVEGKDTFGRDVTAKLAAVDRNFVKGFDRRYRQGLCEPHWIDLDFGNVLTRISDASDAQKIYLVLTGWILPTDTSLNIQIDQNPSLGPLEFPSVWVPDSDAESGWKKAIEYMGFPGGKTKTIVVDVTDVLNQEDPRFRIRTSAQIYWDCAEVAVQGKPAEFRVESVDLLNAEIAFHGFSERLRDDFSRPETYDYQQAELAPRWPPLTGELSRFGDCTDLVRQWDDEMVVMSSGDEIRLQFSVPQTDLPDGWKRDFIFHSVGWDKDADLNTLTGQSTLPLPYREMTRYPPPVEAAMKSQRLRELNSPHLRRRQSFRSFWSRPGMGSEMSFERL